MSSMIPLTILSLDTDETVRNFSIEYFGVLSSSLIHVLAHFQEQRVHKFTFVLDLTYYVNHSL
jgi:hypothetical protein